MSRKATKKEIQIHRQCPCGAHTFDTEEMAIKFNDFKTIGIKRYREKSTGRYINYLNQKLPECACYE